MEFRVTKYLGNYKFSKYLHMECIVNKYLDIEWKALKCLYWDCTTNICLDKKHYASNFQDMGCRANKQLVKEC